MCAREYASLLCHDDDGKKCHCGGELLVSRRWNSCVVLERRVSQVELPLLDDLVRANEGLDKHKALAQVDNICYGI